MLNSFRKVLYAGFALAISVFVAFTFYQELSSLADAARVTAAGFALLLVGSALMTLGQTFAQLGKLSACLMGATLLVILALCWRLEAVNPGVKSATLVYSDGHIVNGVPPMGITAWGRTVTGYNMHPAYGTAAVLNALSVDISDNPAEVMLLISKPQAALYSTGHESTGSDGISIDLQVYNRDGGLVSDEHFLVSQQDFLDKKWIERRIVPLAKFSSIHLTLGTGPPGSSPDYDSTIIALELPSATSRLTSLAKIATISLGAFFVLLFGSLTLENSIKTRNSREIITSTLQLISVLLFVELTAFWSERETSYVFFWDFRNYWQKTEILYELFDAGSWGQAVQLFGSSYASDYSMLPAVLPALLCLVVGYPSRMVYTLIIGAIYAAPAYLLVVHLAKILARDIGQFNLPRSQLGWTLAFLAVFLGLPLFFGTTLYLMPDIGGVVLFIIALLGAFQVINEICAEEKHNSPYLSKTLVHSSIGLGLMFSLMFIFRRWYVFAAAGVAVSLFILVCWELLRGKLARHTVLKRATGSAVLILATGTPLLCWIIFPWSKDLGQHDYSQLYASYKNSPWNDAVGFVAKFGLIPLLLCIIGGVILCRYGRAKRLLFLLTASSVIACAVFLYIQSPGIHHFYLLMPMLGAFMGSLALFLFAKFGSVAPILLCSALVAGGGWATFQAGSSYGLEIFGNYGKWMPQHQKYAQGYADLSAWLQLPENKDMPFCLIASSAEINQGIFLELWQLLPQIAKHAFDARLIPLGQVDSVNGPPSTDVKKCAIFLVAVPFQTHMQPNQQLNLQLIQQDMLTGGGIGAAVSRTPAVFMMDQHIEVRAFKTTRPITELEYEDLVNRFMLAKGTSYTKPADIK